MNNRPLLLLLAMLFMSTTVHAQSKNQTDKAMAILNEWQLKNGAPIVDEEGRVLYTFGESMPQVVCAPLTLCDIKMQSGEQIISVRVGDKIRWIITPARSGSGADASEHLVIKPTQAGLKTTLFVGTDKRVYVIELLSDPVKFMSKVGFIYNESADAQLSSAGSDIQLLPPSTPDPSLANVILPEAQPDTVIDGHEVLAHKLNFDYRVTGPSVAWKPIRVYDDGVKTFIDMDARRVTARDLPVFLINDTDQRGNMINVRYVSHDARYIIDGLFDNGSLVLGVGRKQTKVMISRSAAHGTTNQ